MLCSNQYPWNNKVSFKIQSNKIEPYIVVANIYEDMQYSNIFNKKKKTNQNQFFVRLPKNCNRRKEIKRLILKTHKYATNQTTLYQPILLAITSSNLANSTAYLSWLFIPEWNQNNNIQHSSSQKMAKLKRITHQSLMQKLDRLLKSWPMAAVRLETLL